MTPSPPDVASAVRALGRALRGGASIVAVATAALTGACSPRAATQVDVIVEADETIRAEAASLVLTIEGRGPGGTETQRFEETARFPLRTAIVPRGGDVRRTLSFDVRALDAEGGVIVGTSLTSGFYPGVRAEFTVWLLASCRGVMCPPAQTCREGVCVDTMVEPPDAGLPVSDLDAATPPLEETDAAWDTWQDPCAGCDDGLVCNGLETCVEGSCEVGAPIDCTPRSCDAVAECAEPGGTCVRTPADDDGDAFGSALCGGDDCDDTRAEAHPFAAELCDGLDEDCDRRIDEGAECPVGTACLSRAGTTACRSPICGDGAIEGAELCDPGADPARPDGCGADCRYDDSCASPIDVDVVGTRASGRLSTRFSTVGARPLAPVSCAFADGPDRVFRVRAPATSLTVRTINNNTALVVHRGDGCDGLELGCSEDADGVRPVVSLTGLTMGEVLTIVVDQHYDPWGASQELRIDYP